MKNLIFSVATLLLVFSCQKDETTTNYETKTDVTAKRSCASNDVLAAQLLADPSLATRMNEIEAFTQKTIAAGNLESRLVNGKIEIPVVVNVLYNSAASNLSLTQIQSQIDVLNKDFNALNSDYNSFPSLFSSVKSNVGISFVLDQVVRKSSSKSSWGTRDAMKKSKQGGIDPTSPSTKLNIWACTIGSGILGYAQFPGGTLATDGVVIDSNYFGLSASSSYPYNLGRTATHEVGHWMNLRHIWGDATCGNDLVSDTPVASTANYGVPAFPKYSTCSGGNPEMTMNYMDYTDDRGMYMFTLGQKARIDAIFVAGGARAAFGI